MKKTSFPFWLLLVICLSSTAAAEKRDIFDEPFPATDGQTQSLRQRLGSDQHLVLTFFSATCPCQRLHDPRLLELHRDFSQRGVVLLAVDSEVHSNLERDKKEAKARGYPFPILSDPEGKLAEAFGARFATYSVILGREGELRYRGGLDTDRSRLTENARQWVREGLEKLLAGEAPDPAEAKAFGCYLRR